MAIDPRGERKMGIPKTRNERYTYGDYVTWPDEERWELIEGKAYALTPGPSEDHQTLSLNLTLMLAPYFKGTPCKFFYAPFDVLLPAGKEGDDAVETVVQPDLFVVCDPAKISSKGVRGAPDLIIEILSESNTRRDLDEKLRLYERHGVRGYIIADPWSRTFTVRYLEAGGKFGPPEIFSGNSQMPIRIFEGLVVDLGQL